MYSKAHKQICISFSKNVFYPNQFFLCLDFSLFSLRDFDIMYYRHVFAIFFSDAALQRCTGEDSCLRAISIKLQSHFIEITLWSGCSPVNLLHIFRTLFPKNISGRLLLSIVVLFSYISNIE